MRYRLCWVLALLAFCVVVPHEKANACGTHGSIGGMPATLRADVYGDLDGDGLVNGRLGIVDNFIAPTATTNCVAGVGLGNFSITAPAGIQVTGAQIAIVNQQTGAATPLRNFSFSANAMTTTAFASGGSGVTPLFGGSTWFGFSSVVDPFTLPTLAANEAFELQFDVELPPGDLPLSIPVQFAAGAGDSQGTPDFVGGHVGYFTAADPTAQFAVPEPASLVAWLAISTVLALYCCRRYER